MARDRRTMSCRRDITAMSQSRHAWEAQQKCRGNVRKCARNVGEVRGKCGGNVGGGQTRLRLLTKMARTRWPCLWRKQSLMAGSDADWSCEL